MNTRKPLPHTAKRAATVLMLLALVGIAGCMTARPAVTSTGGSVARMFDNAAAAEERCEQFACEP